MGYFAAAAMNHSNPVKNSQNNISPNEKDTLDYLRQLEADELSPKQAHDSIYRLKEMLRGERNE